MLTSSKSKSEVDIRDHFVRHADAYQAVVHDVNKVLYRNIGIELDQNLEGVVLDIGNGNVFNYDVNKLEHVIAVDVAFVNLKDTERVKYITGDARNLAGVEDESCDRVVVQFLLHHIVDKTKALTDASLLKCLKECHRVLKASGKLVIIEMLVHPWVEQAEDFLYWLSYRLLSFINKPMVKFYSKRGLVSRLQMTGFHSVTAHRIDMGNWIDPFEALFPGRLKLPSILYPAECCSVISIK